MDPGKPSKPRRPTEQGLDDHTDITTASWDEGVDGDRDHADEDASEDGEGGEDSQPSQDLDGTKQTALKITPAPAVHVPTPTHRHLAAPSRDDYDLDPGTPLGEYRIEAKIGQGGMGVVFSAVHPLIGKRAAIKILKKELCADPHSLERFIDEARVVNQIGHPNIVDVFAFGEMPDGRSYFVMEWLKGETLRSRIARSTMSVTEVSNIIRPLARALEAAHEKGVIHRDLKPDNVYLVHVRDEQPTVKLLDFGIAKLARNEHRVEKTATGAIVGTPQYIAPEQAKGYTIDHRVDIYALGGMIFEMLTGRPPFVADNAMEMVAKHLMENPLPPSQFSGGVPPELDELVLGMLAKKPEGRPTLAEVCALLERLKERASTAALFGGFADSGPVRAQTGPVIPTTPVPGPSPTSAGPTARALTGPAFDAARSSPGSAAPRRRGILLAIIGVPIAGLAAFVLVNTISGDSPPRAIPDSTAAFRSDDTVTQVAEPTPVAVAITPGVDAGALDAQSPLVPDAFQVSAVHDPVDRPPTKPRQGRIKLTILGARTEPEILIDGAVGSANQLLDIGAHVVEVHARGMQPQHFQVEVTASGATSKRIQLVPLPPKPRPKADPPKLKVGPSTKKSNPPKHEPSDGELLSPGSLRKN